jgi:hypothetical protein
VNESGRNPWRCWSLLVPTAVLGVALAVQGLGSMHETPRSRGPHLAQQVPAAIIGWRGRNVPLGPNEFLQSTATRILNYDDYVYREFTRADLHFGVYVAYWGSGKMPTRFVASHTPDRCWTENGWRCLQMKFREKREIDGGALQPAE